MGFKATTIMMNPVVNDYFTAAFVIVVVVFVLITLKQD
jgi:hypothetical protein